MSGYQHHYLMDQLETMFGGTWKLVGEFVFKYEISLATFVIYSGVLRKFILVDGTNNTLVTRTDSIEQVKQFIKIQTKFANFI